MSLQETLVHRKMTESSTILIREQLLKKLRDLKEDWTEGNYFERVDEINRLQEILDGYLHH